jgi:tetratricopeptide (TPR) repeat protein
MTSIRKTLIDIQESQSFERLEPFKRASVWKALPKEERTLLAQLIVMQGAQQLAQGDQQVLDSFELAAQISSYAPDILCRQGVILASYPENMRCLMLASQAFSQALQQDSTLFHAWYLRACLLVEIGSFEGEPSYFSEAHQHFEKAYSLLETGIEDVPQEDFFWKWGVCWASLGKISGEPSDFHRAVEQYHMAYQLGCQKVTFLNDYGHSFAELALLLEKPEYFVEALKLFNQAVQQDPQDFEGWYNQGCCIQRLLEYGIQEKWLEEAEQSFEKAAELDPHFASLWLKWGQLETTIGKLKRDYQKIEASLEKFAKAYELEPDDPQVLSCWGETELFLGAQEERLDLIQSARAKISRSLELQPDDPNGWYLYGSCLNELGHYFNEERYYHQAIEKLQYGISLTRQHPLLWYGLALSHFALGELTEEQVYFEKAARHCSLVIECGGGILAQFWNDWGVTLLKLAEMTSQSSYVEMAIAKFERALKQPIQNQQEEGADVDLEWVYNYGCAYDLLGDLTEEPRYLEKAVQILTQVLELDPNYIQARYNLALALSHWGESLFDVEPYYKAIEHFQYLLEQDPEDEIVHIDLGMTLTNLALLVYDQHDPERSQALFREAESHFLQSVALGNSSAYYQLAGLYSITENYDQSMHYLERAQNAGTLPVVEDLLHDAWLEGLRQTPSFRHFVSELSSQQSSDDK